MKFANVRELAPSDFTNFFLSSTREPLRSDVFVYSQLQKRFFFGARENHQIIPAAQGGEEGSVRVLLTKTPSVPSAAPLPGTWYLISMVPVTLAEAKKSLNCIYQSIYLL